jgi:hypothetical protein
MWWLQSNRILIVRRKYMRRFQVDVEYILNQIDPEAIAEYVSEDEQATESLLDMIESDKLCQIVADKYPDDVLEMIVFSKIEQYYLANK